MLCTEYMRRVLCIDIQNILQKAISIGIEGFHLKTCQ